MAEPPKPPPPSGPPPGGGDAGLPNDADIESLLEAIGMAQEKKPAPAEPAGAGSGGAAPPAGGSPGEPPPGPAKGGAGPGAGGASLDSIDSILKEIETREGLPTPPAGGKGGKLPAGVQSASFETFAADVGEKPTGGLDLLMDVQLNVKVELGRAKLLLQDVLKLTSGSVVELDRLAGDPLSIYVNERLVARGEVLVLNDAFCVRITEILSPLPKKPAK